MKNGQISISPVFYKRINFAGLSQELHYIYVAWQQIQKFRIINHSQSTQTFIQSFAEKPWNCKKKKKKENRKKSLTPRYSTYWWWPDWKVEQREGQRSGVKPGLCTWFPCQPSQISNGQQGFFYEKSRIKLHLYLQLCILGPEDFWD